MKRAVSISIGSSKRNKAVEVTLLGEKVSIERIGTDGDRARHVDDDAHLGLLAARHGQDERAQQVYREVLLHFPGDDPSSCRKKAQENIVSITSSDNE